MVSDGIFCTAAEIRTERGRGRGYQQQSAISRQACSSVRSQRGSSAAASEAKDARNRTRQTPPTVWSRDIGLCILTVRSSHTRDS